MMRRIIADGRNGYARVVPSSKALPAFRASHREVTFRSYEIKETAKVHVENRDYIQPFSDFIAKLDGKHLGMLENPNGISNLH